MGSLPFRRDILCSMDERYFNNADSSFSSYEKSSIMLVSALT
eukprot:CAMPEP_0203655436 /NCGR_PEP_ID=MMETSP0088-20131115/38295_1 /ASSEMBLY_ACC=CAM_ASM_001087 /TAXON_ID=426623 /ORGANISM="Chaetoceros affinis, Strain CCMP159" /LENGTH=41 /DNA_ID= /DNA_START= /DNA_END= /DNA_ORIENTATION=